MAKSALLWPNFGAVSSRWPKRPPPLSPPCSFPSTRTRGPFKQLQRVQTSESGSSWKLFFAARSSHEMRTSRDSLQSRSRAHRSRSIRRPPELTGRSTTSWKRAAMIGSWWSGGPPVTNQEVIKSIEAVGAYTAPIKPPTTAHQGNSSKSF
jgi:hypothetical protein